MTSKLNDNCNKQQSHNYSKFIDNFGNEEYAKSQLISVDLLRLVDLLTLLVLVSLLNLQYQR